jgi:hypothetical protein
VILLHRECAGIDPDRFVGDDSILFLFPLYLSLSSAVSGLRFEHQPEPL